MPRLLKRPPKYGRHKASGQACVYVNGREVYLGKYGSSKSHEKYREFLAEWKSTQAVIEQDEAAQAAQDSLAKTLHPAALRRKRREGGVVTLDELIFVYRRHASSYYVKYGKVTREAELIVELTTLLGKKHGDEPVDEFGPVQLDSLEKTLVIKRLLAAKFGVAASECTRPKKKRRATPTPKRRRRRRPKPQQRRRQFPRPRR